MLSMYQCFFHRKVRDLKPRIEPALASKDQIFVAHRPAEDDDSAGAAIGRCPVESRLKAKRTNFASDYSDELVQPSVVVYVTSGTAKSGRNKYIVA